MTTSSHNIKIYNHSKHNNFFEGIIDDNKWFAIVKDQEVNNAINPKNLKVGKGKVVRLCIYNDNRDIEGNPFLPSVTIKRTIYVNFIEEWKVFNLGYRSRVKDLVNYLERIKTMHIVKDES
jgi:hypothetical protein